jgi:hypothetical protein
MSILVLLSSIVLFLSLFFLALSIGMIMRRYTLKGSILAVFFLIISVQYILVIYYEFQGIQINLLLFVISDILIIISLFALVISR